MTDPDLIDRLTDALLSAPSASERDRTLLEAGLALCAAPFGELWRCVDTEAGPSWWPVCSQGDPECAPDRALVRESLAGRFGGGLPGGAHVLREGGLAVVLGEVRSDGPELDLVEGLLIVCSAVDLPLSDALDAPIAPAPRSAAARAIFSLQATRALLDPDTVFEVDGEPEGAQLGVAPEAFAALLLDLGSAVRNGGSRAALRVGTTGDDGSPLLELHARMDGSGSGSKRRHDDFMARAREHGLDAECLEDDAGMSITLRLPIIARDAA